MHNSFYKLYDDMVRAKRAEKKLLAESEAPDVDDQIKAIINRGIEIRPDRADGQTFWDDFLKVINGNPDAASKLLGVSRETMAQWPSKIREALAVIRAGNDHAGKKKKKTMLTTGDLFF